MAITFEGGEKALDPHPGSSESGYGPGVEAYNQSSLPRVPERTSSISASVVSAPELTDSSEFSSSMGHKERMEYRKQRERILKRMQKNWKPKSIEEQVHRISHTTVEWDEKIRKARIKAKLWKAAKWLAILLAVGAIVATTATLTAIHVNKKNGSGSSTTELSASSTKKSTGDALGLPLFPRDKSVLGKGGGGLWRIRKNVEKLLSSLDEELEEDQIGSVNLIESANGYSMVLDRSSLAQMRNAIKEMAEEDLAFLQKQLEDTIQELHCVAKGTDCGTDIETHAFDATNAVFPQTSDQQLSGQRKLLQQADLSFFDMDQMFLDTIMAGAARSLLPQDDVHSKYFKEAEERLVALSEQ